MNTDNTSLETQKQPSCLGAVMRSCSFCRNFADTTRETYVSNVKIFFEKSIKDHPKNINEEDIRKFLSQFNQPNTQRILL